MTIKCTTSATYSLGDLGQVTFFSSSSVRWEITSSSEDFVMMK